MSRYVVRATYYINHDDRRAVHSTIACENYEDAQNVSASLRPYRVCEIMYRVHNRHSSVLVPVDTILDVVDDIRADMDDYTKPPVKASNGPTKPVKSWKDVPAPPVPSWDEDDLSIDGAV